MFWWFDRAQLASNYVESIKFLWRELLAARQAEEAAFGSAVKAWSGKPENPGMPDEALAFKALAEEAFREKRYLDALDAYCEALDRFPMWPEGQFNAALLAAEVEDYGLAALHMRRYLALVPDAKDAAASKEKMLLWQLKAKE